MKAVAAAAAYLVLRTSDERWRQESGGHEKSDTYPKKIAYTPKLKTHTILLFKQIK
ncbi:hypothetical protein [Paenibacillus xylanilyticus]|uniref:hypothetical protein n=1 Tax=Paenibacillus xylanilyticus TaxID=248903 RepID=UPI0039A2ACA1